MIAQTVRRACVAVIPSSIKICAGGRTSNPSDNKFFHRYIMRTVNTQRLEANFLHVRLHQKQGSARLQKMFQGTVQIVMWTCARECMKQYCVCIPILEMPRWRNRQDAELSLLCVCLRKLVHAYVRQHFWFAIGPLRVCVSFICV